MYVHVASLYITVGMLLESHTGFRW